MPDAVRTLVLVDGEHYPPVVRAAIDELRARPCHLVGAALLGGTEKMPAGEAPDLGVPEIVTGSNPLEVVCRAIDRWCPEEIVDLSDEPALDPRTRLRVAAHALRRGVRYRGADFVFMPPERPRRVTKPSVAVIGSGKRAGKTAIAAHLARRLARRGRSPVIVTMGRGGPGEAEVIDPATFDLSPRGLLALVEEGRHAASDHVEDALTAGVVTIGTRRCGGGLAGTPASDNFAAGIDAANERAESFAVLEGSGVAIPPVHADATACVIPDDADPELVAGYLGPVALLLADLIVITLHGELPPDEGRHSGSPPELESRILDIVPGVPVVRTVLRPWPLSSIAQRSVFYATTAPQPVAVRAAEHLETRHHAVVVGWTNRLADRDALVRELATAPPGVEVLVTEIKAAAIDVATRVALDRGWEVVYCDNRPDPAGASSPDLAVALDRVTDLAAERFAAESQ